MSNKILVAQASPYDLVIKAVQPKNEVKIPKAVNAAVNGKPSSEQEFPLVNVADSLKTSLHVIPQRFSNAIINQAQESKATPSNPLYVYMVHEDVVQDPQEMGIFGTTVSNTIHAGYRQSENFQSGESLNYQKLIDNASLKAGLEKGSIRVLVANYDIARAMVAFNEGESEIKSGNNLAVWKNGKQPRIILAKNWSSSKKNFEDGLEIIDLNKISIPSNFTSSLDKIFGLALGSELPSNVANLIKSTNMLSMINRVLGKIAKAMNKDSSQQDQEFLHLFSNFMNLNTEDREKLKRSSSLNANEQDLNRFSRLVETNDTLAKSVANFVKIYIKKALELVKLPANTQILTETSDYLDFIFKDNAQVTTIKQLDDLDPRADFGGARYLAKLHQDYLRTKGN